MTNTLLAQGFVSLLIASGTGGFIIYRIMVKQGCTFRDGSQEDIPVIFGGLVSGVVTTALVIELVLCGWLPSWCVIVVAAPAVVLLFLLFRLVGQLGKLLALLIDRLF